MPNEITGCDVCGFDGLLNLVNAFKSKFTPNKLCTTYQCPNCNTPYYDAEPILPISELR